jgi:APA family basic amino acid/polyamine antiporter
VREENPAMSSPQLRRELGLWTCISIVVGSVIGSSIFMKPATMAAQTGSPLLLLSVWVVAGIVSLFGGMINAEIGTILPKTGGQYVYFRHMYGEFFAFLYGWASFIVINTAALASIAFVFAQYSEYFITLPRFGVEIEKSIFLSIPFIGTIFPLENIGVKSLAILLILIFTGINYRSVKAGGAVQVLFSVLKVAALILLVSVIFFSGKGSWENFFTDSVDRDASMLGIVTGFIAATSGALAAYDGWNNLGFVAGEIKNPKRNIPRGLIIGLGICILMYILTTQAYLYVLPIDEMKKSSLVASDALKVVMGGGGLIALLVMVSSAGATNGNLLPCARINFAMAEQGKFFSKAAKVHSRFHTPYNALLLQGIWSSLFVLSGSFDMLTDMFVFMTWIFYGFAAYGIFILRRKMPNIERPYKVWGYPVVPIIFILFTGFYFTVTLYTEINNYISGRSYFINSVFGLFLTLVGIPFYWYFKTKNKPA